MKTRTKTRDEEMDGELAARAKRPSPGENEIMLRDLVGAFVQYPAGVRTTSALDEGGGETLTLAVRAEDQPRVWGQGGRHIQALRTIFQFIGAREERRITLILLEPAERARGAPQQPFTPSMDWDSAPTVALLARVLRRVLRKEFTTQAYSPSARALEAAGLPTASSMDYETRIDVAPDAAEQVLCAGIVEYLKPIFHAIGKNQGREVKLGCTTEEGAR
jgi:predicted RNA-binding protein YlqC (UPF0109 family)